MAVPLILDTDIGMDVDDAIALCFAALDDRVDLRAVTTVNGNTQQRASVARALLRLAGRPDVPVGAGARVPIDDNAHAFMPSDHVDMDPVQAIVDDEHPSALDVLTAALESTDEPITICTIGPVTNIVALLSSRPDLVQSVARIQVMGGCLAPYQVDGTDGPEHEFNVSCDALATSALLALPLPIGVIPIDVTVDAYFTEAHRAAIRAAGHLGHVLDKLMDNFLGLLALLWPQASPKVRLHDPLTVATLIAPEVATFERATVAAYGPHGSCRTVLSPHGRAVDRCAAVDNERLASLLVQTLSAQSNAAM